MSPQPSRAQLALLLGMTLVVGILLALLVYVIYRLFRRRQAPGSPELWSSRSSHPAVFMSSTVQAVIANLKSQQKDLEERHRTAEDRADETARITEIISREMPTGLMVFNREGFLTLSNSAARRLLGIDNWSRRRYPEIFGPEAILTARIRESLEAGREQGWETLEVRTTRGEPRTVKLFLSLYHGRNGERRGIVFLVGEVTGTTTRRG